MSPDRTKESAVSYFSSRAYALVSRSKQACLGSACSDFAKKNRRLLAVYSKREKAEPRASDNNYLKRSECAAVVSKHNSAILRVDG